MQRSLSGQGFNLVRAMGGEDGLRLAKELLLTVISLDVMMPGMDSWEVLPALKADPDLAGRHHGRHGDHNRSEKHGVSTGRGGVSDQTRRPWALDPHLE